MRGQAPSDPSSDGRASGRQPFLSTEAGSGESDAASITALPSLVMPRWARSSCMSLSLALWPDARPTARRASRCANRTSLPRASGHQLSLPLPLPLAAPLLFRAREGSFPPILLPMVALPAASPSRFPDGGSGESEPRRSSSVPSLVMPRWARSSCMSPSLTFSAGRSPRQSNEPAVAPIERRSREHPGHQLSLPLHLPLPLPLLFRAREGSSPSSPSSDGRPAGRQPFLSSDGGSGESETASIVIRPSLVLYRWLRGLVLHVAQHDFLGRTLARRSNGASRCAIGHRFREHPGHPLPLLFPLPLPLLFRTREGSSPSDPSSDGCAAVRLSFLSLTETQARRSRVDHRSSFRAGAGSPCMPPHLALSSRCSGHSATEPAIARSLTTLLWSFDYLVEFHLPDRQSARSTKPAPKMWGCRHLRQQTQTCFKR